MDWPRRGIIASGKERKINKMTQRKVYDVVAGSLALVMVGQFVCFPVFAEGPVNIEILQVVDEETGEAWQDIVGAMPGVTYSAIPRVRNDGVVPVSVRMCLSESATDALGNSINLPANTFGIDIDSRWVLDSESSKDASDPAVGNCYDYNAMLEPGAMTEPIFTEVRLSSELGNEYENSTFGLHLDAEAKGDLLVEPDNPNSPDTGANSAREAFLINSGLIFATAGVLALIIMGIKKLFCK